MSDFDSNSDPYGVSGTDGTPEGGPGPMGVPPQGPSGKRGFFSRKRNIVITTAVAVVGVAGISIGLVAATGSSSTTTTASAGSTSSSAPGFPGASGQGANARTTNEPGGTAGTVSSISGSTFTIKTTVGETMTINEGSSTAYENASSGSATATAASAITTGAGVLVLGTVNGTTITATQVTIEPAGSAYTTASADVSAEQKGQQNTSQTYGTIPSDYTEGQGTIVDAATSDQAVTAALAKYPGGIVDRVVQLSNGDYEVHDIGTNMHHIFENSSFQVIGAN
ncbi:MAG TPA: hypothetical protein VH372_03320 [Actinospica sp.]|nr:hypothetical protein [Actinospica sp.]